MKPFRWRIAEPAAGCTRSVLPALIFQTLPASIIRLAEDHPEPFDRGFARRIACPHARHVWRRPDRRWHARFGRSRRRFGAPILFVARFRISRIGERKSGALESVHFWRRPILRWNAVGPP